MRRLALPVGRLLRRWGCAPRALHGAGKDANTTAAASRERGSVVQAGRPEEPQGASSDSWMVSLTPAGAPPFPALAHAA